jgi:hypothetical protein
MHWNVEQILWALLLAAHLVLLVVLLGRDRVSRFPWFTAAIALSAVRLLADHLLHGKLTTVAFYWQSYSAMVVDNIFGILVLVELAGRVFSSGKAGLLLKARGWIGWTLVTVALATAAVWAWGPWPTWVALKAEPAQLPLLLVVLTAMKGLLFVSLMTVQAGLLLRIFGKRFGYGWRSHAQQIMLGLSTNALCFLAVQGTMDIIKRTVHLTTRQEYERVVHLFAKLENARSALWFLVLVWWMVWLWRDEPGEPAHSSTQIAAQEATGLVRTPSFDGEAAEPEADRLELGRLEADSRLDSE